MAVALYICLYLIELTSGQECQCYPIGTKSSDMFSPAGCENTTTHSYCLENDFYYDTDSTYNETIIQKTLTINSTKSFKLSNYFRLVDNVVLTQNGAFHVVNKTTIGANSQLLVNTFYSLAGDFQLENPQLNRPQIILWNSSYLHLNRNITNRVDFQIKNPIGNTKCFDAFSLNNGNNLNINEVDNNCILSTMFPYKFDDGTGYLISSQRLLRFCPNGTNLANTVTCTLIKRLYTDANYSPNYSPQTFDYPHCPCNSDKTLNCELKLFGQISSFEFNTKSLDNTHIFVEKNVSLANLKYPKKITIADDVNLNFYGRMSNTVFYYSFGEIKFDANQIPFTTPCSVKFDTSTNTFSCNKDMIFSVNFTKKFETFVINSLSEITSLNLFSNSTVFILGKTKLNNIVPMYFGEFDKSYVIMNDGTS
ncbi:protein kinase domain containing protein, partial [Entamoeba invadens IP1]